MQLFEDTASDPSATPSGGNLPEFSVSELSGAVKRVIEGEFGRVRVRGEVGRVSRPASGHMYFDLKDDRSVVAAISWKGQVAKMQIHPEEGMEVVVSGHMTTFPGQSKYQLIVDDIAPAGAGALMAMLEARRVKLLSEGLFEADRKQSLPYLPQVIGVITSPSGAVIRDILHRLRNRFPRHVLIWPVAVQGRACAPEVAAAIAGFNTLEKGGPIPRPDVLIVARGGGSIEDLWGFNEEIVVRAAARSDIPLISAVGHETDTTLLDFAADQRAPTPTAAAEMAVPVRQDVQAALDMLGARQTRALANCHEMRSHNLRTLARALPRLEALIDPAAQRYDLWSIRLAGALEAMVARKKGRFDPIVALLRPQSLILLIRRLQGQLSDKGRSLNAAQTRQFERPNDRASSLFARLDPALLRLISQSARDLERGRGDLDKKSARLELALGAQFAAGQKTLTALERIRQSLGYDQTLRRGFAVVRSGGGIVTSAQAARQALSLELEFYDGRLALDPGALAAVSASANPSAPPAKKHKDQTPPDQGQLF